MKALKSEGRFHVSPSAKLDEKFKKANLVHVGVVAGRDAQSATKLNLGLDPVIRGGIQDRAIPYDVCPGPGVPNIAHPTEETQKLEKQ